MPALMLILMLPLILLVAPAAEATIFYDEDFETDLTAWSFGGEPNTTVTLSTDTALTGSQSLKMVYPNDESGGGTAMFRYYPNQTHIFMRYGVQVAPGFVVGSNRFSKVMLMGTDWGGFPTFGMELSSTDGGFAPPNGYHVQIYAYDCNSPINDPDVVFETTSVNPMDGQWHQMEFEAQLNDPGVANGLFRWWIDGNLIVETLNRQFRGPTPSSTACFDGGTFGTPSTVTYYATEIYRQSGNGTLYLDRVAVGDTRIGLVSGSGTPITPGSVPPNAPVNLQLSYFVWKLLALLNPYIAWTWST